MHDEAGALGQENAPKANEGVGQENAPKANHFFD